MRQYCTSCAGGNPEGPRRDSSRSIPPSRAPMLHRPRAMKPTRQYLPASQAPARARLLAPGLARSVAQLQRCCCLSVCSFVPCSRRLAQSSHGVLTPCPGHPLTQPDQRAASGRASIHSDFGRGDRQEDAGPRAGTLPGPEVTSRMGAWGGRGGRRGHASCMAKCTCCLRATWRDHWQAMHRPSHAMLLHGAKHLLPAMAPRCARTWAQRGLQAPLAHALRAVAAAVRQLCRAVPRSPPISSCGREYGDSGRTVRTPLEYPPRVPHREPPSCDPFMRPVPAPAFHPSGQTSRKECAYSPKS